LSAKSIESDLKVIKIIDINYCISAHYKYLA
jgi:hypothetical protein